MAEQNIKMNVKTDTGYDTLYPQTKADIVSFNDTQSVVKGKTVQENLKNTADALYHPNLLINGDFQCNQRGKAEYNFNLYGTQGNSGGTVDMWRVANSSTNKLKIIPVDGGSVKYECSGGDNPSSFLYILPEFLKNGSYRIICSLKNKTGSVILRVNNNEGTYTEYTLQEGLNIIELNQSIKSIVYRISTGNGVIEYTRLNKGTVAYPHIKEDFDSAFKKCSAYLFHHHFKKYEPIGIYKYTGEGNACYGSFNIRHMKADPTIKINGVITVYARSSGLENEFNIQPTPIKLYKEINVLHLLVPLKNMKRGDVVMIQAGSDLDVTISCEPLP